MGNPHKRKKARKHLEAMKAVLKQDIVNVSSTPEIFVEAPLALEIIEEETKLDNSEDEIKTEIEVLESKASKRKK